MEGKPYEVETQTPDLTAESLIEAKRLIGVDYRGAKATIEITKDNIKDYCNYMGSQNPLFLDEGYAQKTRWGGIIAPPTMVGTAIIAPGLRGIQWIYAGTEWEFFGVMRPGDFISQRGRLSDAEEKKGKTAPSMILQIGETLCTNQRNELVAKAKVYCLRVPRAQSRGGMGYKPRLQQWSEEELRRIEEEMMAEEIRGANPRYWQDVSIGEEMKPVAYGPLRIVDIALSGCFTDAGAISGEGVAHAGAHYYQFLRRRRHPADAFTDPITGIPDHPHRGHWEAFMAQEVGMPGIYDIGPHRLSWLCRFITDWMGDDAFLKKLGGFLRRPNIISDVTRIKGKVVRKWQEGGDFLVECQIWGENQLGEMTMPGYAIVSLPSR